MVEDKLAAHKTHSCRGTKIRQLAELGIEPHVREWYIGHRPSTVQHVYMSREDNMREKIEGVAKKVKESLEKNDGKAYYPTAQPVDDSYKQSIRSMQRAFDKVIKKLRQAEQDQGSDK